MVGYPFVEDLFIDMQPRKCLWCRDCVFVVRNETDVPELACKRLLRSGGTYMPVEADDVYACFKPTLREDGRLKILDRLGVLGDFHKALLWNK